MKFVIVSLLFVSVLLTPTITGSSYNNEKGMECLQREELEQKNLKVVNGFFQQVIGQQDLSALDKYISCDYVQHDPYVADGPQGVKEYLTAFIANKKKGPVHFARVAAYGDLVWVHFRTTGLNNEPWAVVDIFRVKDGLIVEHWDVFEVIPPRNESMNSNPVV